MPKRAPQNEEIDPVRSRLAAAASVPAASTATPRPTRSAVSEDAGQGHTEQPERPPVAARVDAGALSVNRKMMVTPEEADLIDSTIAVIAQGFGGRVNYSQVSRAIWSILANAEDAIRASGRRAPKRTAPSTGNRLAMAEYEQELTVFLGQVFKRS